MRRIFSPFTYIDVISGIDHSFCKFLKINFNLQTGKTESFPFDEYFYFLFFSISNMFVYLSNQQIHIEIKTSTKSASNFLIMLIAGLKNGESRSVASGSLA